jgi:hypothetical protein
MAAIPGSNDLILDFSSCSNIAHRGRAFLTHFFLERKKNGTHFQPKKVQATQGFSNRKRKKRYRLMRASTLVLVWVEAGAFTRFEI